MPKQRALWVFGLVLGFGILFLHTPTGLKTFNFPIPDAATMDRGVPKLFRCISIPSKWYWVSSGVFGYYLGGMVTEGRFWER